MPHAKCLPRQAWLIAGLLAAMPACAQQDAPAAVDYTVTVSATRTTLPVAETPAAVTVITRQEIEESGVEKIDELLALIPGIDVRRPNGLYTLTPEVSLRGMGAQPGRTLVMIDGIPANKTDTGSFNWNRIDPALVERVEVVPGPASGVWGSHAMGGVINIVTKRPREDADTTVTVGAGNLETVKGSFVTRGTAAQVGYRVHGHYLNSAGYDPLPEPSQARTAYTVPRNTRENSLAVRVAPNIGESGTVWLDYYTYNDRRDEGERIQDPRGVYRKFDTEQWDAIYAQRVGSVDLNAKLYTMTEDYFWNRERMQGASYTRYGVVVDRTETGMLLQAGWQPSVGRITTGIDYRRGSVDGADQYTAGPNAGLNVVNQGKQRVIGLFSQYEIDLPQARGSAIIGGRYDWASVYDGRFVDETNGLPDGPLPGGGWPESDWSAFSPKVGIKSQVGPSTDLWASAGRGFRPPILDELFRSGIFMGRYYRANPGLQPESVWSYELGVDQRLARQTTARVTGYYSDASDFLYAVLLDPNYDPRPLYERRNVAGVVIRGVEAEIGHRFSSRLSGYVNATWNSSRINAYTPLNASDADLTGTLLEYTPCHKYNAGLEYRQGAWYIGLTGHYVGEQYANPNNTARIDAYTVADLSVRCQASENYTVECAVRNLGDRRFTQGNYYELRNGAWVNRVDPADPNSPYLRNVSLDPGRTFILSVARTW